MSTHLKLCKPTISIERQFVIQLGRDSGVRIFNRSYSRRTFDRKDSLWLRRILRARSQAPTRRYDWNCWREAKSASSMNHSRRRTWYSLLHSLQRLRPRSNIFPPMVDACRWNPPARRKSRFAKMKIKSISRMPRPSIRRVKTMKTFMLQSAAWDASWM